MPTNGISNESTTDGSETGTVEERVRQLETAIGTLRDENEDLKAALEQQQANSGFSAMTRRGALGVLSGGALLGAASSASARGGDNNGNGRGSHGHGNGRNSDGNGHGGDRGRGGGPPFADEDHDHSGDSIAPSNLSVQDWEWVDMAAAGADPTGEEDVVPVMEEAAGDNTLLVFPPGRYLMAGSFIQHEHDSFGIRGINQPVFTIPEDFQPPENHPWEGGADRLFNLGSWVTKEDKEIENLYFGGFDLDFTEDGVGWAPFNLTANNWVMEDITVRGSIPSTPDLFWAYVLDEEGHALIRNVRFPDGVDHGIEDIFSAGTSCFIGAQSKGNLRFEDCVMKYGGGNGIRIGHPSPSNVVIDGGVYGNSDRAAFRIGGTGHHVVQNCDIIIDDHRTGFGNLRGIWVQRAGQPGLTGKHVFENVRIRVEDVPEASTPLWVSSDSGNVVARNIFIEDNRGSGDQSLDTPTIDVSSGDETTRVTLENIYVAGGRANSHVVRLRSPNNLLRNVFAPELNSATDTTIHVEGAANHTHAEEVYLDPEVGSIVVDGASDCAIEDVNEAVSIGRSSAPRLRVNGWGYNQGDPSAEGDWADHGIDGLQVHDAQNGDNYVYVDGSWRSL